MSNEQFDDIENLGRDAADKHSLPFKEEAWDKMLQLLDEDEKKRRPLIWWWWALPLVLMLGAGGGYWAVKNNSKQQGNHVATQPQSISSNQKKSPIDSAPAIQTDVEPDSAIAIKSAIKPSENNTNTIAKKQIAAINPPAAINNNEPTAANKSITKKTANTTTVKFGEAVRNRNAADKSFVTKAQKDKPFIANIYKTGKNAMSPNSGTKSSDTVDSTITKAVDKSVLPITDSSTSVTASKDTTAKNVAEATTKPAKKEKKAPIKFPRWDISASVSCDVTTVKFKKANKVSMGYGFGVSYRFANRFSISTGLAITRKLYVADSTNYDKDLYAAYHWRVSNIDANCNVIEVPINLQYRVTNGLKNNLFVTAGLSSYFMKTETYDFTYLRYGVPGKTSYTYKNQSNERLAILNLSVDYSRKLSKQFALSISPFAKVPLTGVGKGNVSLTSMGLQVGLHYQPK